ncbi:hypothetical protein G8770_03530 [Aestuariicella hydrocarbonica]|uniref:Uncharacterized protein n=1 Tax=Pseudomaricurvus hydrocarbonicus TaxID=1470433 RepID=A0A9E5JU79_9GAMM|nr:hypothetical protein [Aestuariicella hydrocarbonica]NHO64616.1 hypothetical protein [Aestuariicella hydrocarbonica]
MATKSLGTLTLDLVAKVGGFVQGMDKAERESAKWRKQVEKDIKTVGKTFAGLSVASAAGLAYVAKDLADSSKELKNFSALANTTTQDFQKLSFGAGRYGVEQDKVADILKDTNDKIGDFLQTGGGPLADFFDNIAPAIGITADEFARMSGPQALQAYVNGLEKANLSQSEMTFYMEAIASDSTLLLPLLRNNGKEMRAFGDEAERTGNVLSDLEIAQLDDITKGVDDLTAQFTGMKNEVALAALPAVSDLIDLLSDESTINAAESLGKAVVTSMTAAANAVSGVINVTKFLGEELAAVTQGIAADDIARLERDSQKIQNILDGGFFDQAERVRFFGPDGVVSFLTDEELKAKLEENKRAIQAYYDSENNKPKVDLQIDSAVGTASTIDPTVTRKSSRDDADEIAKQTAAIDKQIAALKLQAETLGFTNKEAAIYRLTLDGATEAQLANAQAAYATIEAFEAEKDANDQKAEAIKLITELLPEQERALQRIVEQEKFLNDAVAASPELAEQAAAAFKALDDQRKEVIEGVNEFSVFADEAARNMQGLLADALSSGFDDGAGNLLKKFGDLLLDMAAQAAAAQIFESLGFAGSSKSSGSSSSSFDWGQVASFVGGFFADGGRPPSNKISVVGERGPELFIPDGVTGEVISNDNINMAAMREDRINPTRISIGNMNFPGVTNPRDAELASGAASRRLLATIASADRFR